MYYTKLKIHMCNIILVGDEMGLHFLHLATKDCKRHFEIIETWEYNNNFFKQIVKEIEEYFQGKRKQFTIKLHPIGTDYQKSIWKEMTKISYGKLTTYKNVAENLKNPKAARAVGNAISKNPIPLIMPCHRVIGTSGKLIGFAGLDPKVYESGNFKARSTRMSKRGNSLLRYHLVFTAFNLTLNNKTFKDYYDKKRSEGKSHYNALGHISNKVIRVLYKIMTENIPFNLA